MNHSLLPASLIVLLLFSPGCIQEKRSTETANSQGADISPATTEITVTETAEKNTTEDFFTYENPDYGIGIAYPSDWKIDVSDYGDQLKWVTFSGEGPYPANESSVTINVKQGSSELSLGKYTDMYLGSIKDTYKSPQSNFEIIESTDASLAGLPAHRLIYAVDLLGKRGKVLEVWTLKKDKIYSVRFISDEEGFSRYYGTVEKMINSFELI